MKTKEQYTNEVIVDILNRLGIQANLKGYDCLKQGIYILLDDPSKVHCMTKELYPDIAKGTDSNPARVDRNIRSAVKKVFDRNDSKELEEVFGRWSSRSGKLTNSEFIATLAEKVRLKVDEYKDFLQNYHEHEDGSGVTEYGVDEHPEAVNIVLDDYMEER